MTTIEAIGILLGSLGGFELIKWMLTRKANTRTAEAEAAGAELTVLKETVVFLEEQLKTKEERFAEQTTLVRKLNAENLELTRKLAEKEIELAVKRCDDMPCPFRQPPTATTQPMASITREQYFKSRIDEKH